jgi:hypothetical protein
VRRITERLAKRVAQAEKHATAATTQCIDQQLHTLTDDELRERIAELEAKFEARFGGAEQERLRSLTDEQLLARITRFRHRGAESTDARACSSVRDGRSDYPLS